MFHTVVPTVIGITVPVLVLVVLSMVALILILHYTGFLGEIKAHLPAALLVGKDGLTVYTL